MMSKRHPNTTRYLGVPADWKPEHGECGHLAIADVQGSGGLPMMESFWEPTPAELEALNAGGHVLLSIVGTGHPPVWIGVVPASQES